MADQEQGVSAPNPPPAPAETGKQAQQQKQHQDHVAPQAQAPAAQQPGQQVVHLNWSYFKPEFSGKPDKDAEAHLLCTSDWMNAHHFIKVSKSKDFVLHYWEKPDYGVIH